MEVEIGGGEEGRGGEGGNREIEVEGGGEDEGKGGTERLKWKECNVAGAGGLS